MIVGKLTQALTAERRLRSRLQLTSGEFMLTLPRSRTARQIDEPDAHGQAALVLVESLLHSLIEKGTLSNAEALEILRSAAEVKVEVAEAAGESETRIQESLALLSRISVSLESDT